MGNCNCKIFLANVSNIQETINPDIVRGRKIEYCLTTVKDILKK